MIAMFDIGSTLVDGPRYGPPRRLAEMLGLGESALPELDRLLFETPSEGPEDLAVGIARLFDVPRPDALHACAELWEAQIREAYVVPGARELVDALRAEGIPRAYLSNIWPPFYRHFRTEFPSEADAPQFLSFRSGRMKPDPEFYREALRKLDAPPGEIVMIGDTYTNDILPAIQLGMRTVWLLHRPDKELASLVRVLNGDAPPPDLTLASIRELQPCTLSAMNCSPKPSY